VAKKTITKEERTEAIEQAFNWMLRRDPTIDRFVLAQLLITVAERVLPEVEE
jgi:hypothetical protein